MIAIYVKHAELSRRPIHHHNKLDIISSANMHENSGNIGAAKSVKLLCKIFLLVSSHYLWNSVQPNQITAVITWNKKRIIYDAIKFAQHAYL